MANPNNAGGMTPAELMAAFLASGGDVNALAKQAKKKALAACKEKVARPLRSKGTNQPVFAMNISNWAALREFMLIPPTAEDNPGGPMFEEFILDAQDAIDDEDAPRLAENLLVILKAVKRR